MRLRFAWETPAAIVNGSTRPKRRAPHVQAFVLLVLPLSSLLVLIEEIRHCLRGPLVTIRCPRYSGAKSPNPHATPARPD